MSTPSWSPDVMIERIGGDEELARQLVTLFLGDCDRMLSVLRAGVAERNPEAVRRAAHAIKGSAGLFSQGTAFESTRRLERMASSGEREGLDATLADVEAAMAQLTRELGRIE